MKKLILPIILIILGTTCYFVFNRIDPNLEKIKVAEVAHSIFYAPQYVAHAEEYFKEEGLDVEFLLTPGADKVTAAVLSGDVQIGFAGSEASIYVYNNGEEDYLVNFAALTKRDGSFIVGRTPNENFTLNDLKGKTIIGGRIGGMPEMTLEMILTQNGINPKTDLTIDTSIAFASMSGAFVSGIGDYVSLFEPSALALEKEGLGYVVASLGELGGVVPYTTYQAKNSYISENPEVIEKFVNATQKGLDFVHKNDAKTIAEIILPYFPDISLNDLTKIVDRYKSVDSWFETTYITEEGFNYVQDIAENASQLDTRAPYEKLIDNTYNEQK